MAFGDALAMGIVKGIGTGYSQHIQDQRRERMENRRMDKSFDMFKKQKQYSFGLEAIGKENESLGAWEEAAKLGVNDLAFKAATKMAGSFSKEDRPKIIRDSMKNFNGMSKAELLSRAGYNKPDYSQWIDNPDYQDAIPQSRIAGMKEMPGASDVFKYDPRAYEQEQAKVAEKLTDYQRKKKDEFNSINTMGVVSFGAGLSDDVKNYIWKNRPEGVTAQLKGSEVVSYDQNLLTSLVNEGQVVKVGNTMKFVGALEDREKEMLGIGAPTAPQEPTDVKPLYSEPETQQYLSEKEQKEATAKMDSAIKSMGKDLGTGKGTPLTTHTELTDAKKALETMNEDALSYMFSAGFSLDTVRDISAKFGNEEAQKAKDLISKMSSSVNAIRHELFGSALTEGEAEAFKKQFADVGVFNSKENLSTQLQHLIDKAEMGTVEKMAGYTPEQRAAFLERNPQYAGVMRRVVETDDTQDPERKQTVSDSSGKDVSASIPQEFWNASPEKQQQFLKQYGLTLGGK